MIQLAKIFPFIVWFRLTTLETIKADFFAGLTGAIIVLPQSVAFATIAGMPPEYGLYTAMVVPLLLHFLGRLFILSLDQQQQSQSLFLQQSVSMLSQVLKSLFHWL